MTSFNMYCSDYPVCLSNGDLKNSVDDNFYHDKGDTFSITAFDDANYLNSESYSYFICPPEAQSKEDSNDNNYLYSNPLSMEPTYQDLKNSQHFDSNFSILNLDTTEENFRNYDPLENSSLRSESTNHSDNKLFQIEDNLSGLNLSHNVTNDAQDVHLLVPEDEYDLLTRNINPLGTPGEPSIKEEEDPYDLNRYLEESSLDFHNSPDRPSTSSSSYLNSPYTAPNSPSLLLPNLSIGSSRSPSGSQTSPEDRLAYLRDKNNQASREYRKRKRNKQQELKNTIKEQEDRHELNLVRKSETERQIDVMNSAISMVWQKQGQIENE